MASIPGATNPVHDTGTRWVTASADKPLSARAARAAATASGGACSAYIRIRTAVVGPSGSGPGRNGDVECRVPFSTSRTTSRPWTICRVFTPLPA